MDPVTHTLAGATMARAGLDRRTPLATAALLLGTNAPDIDIFTAFGGPGATLALRRGCSHGPLAMVFLPFAVTGVLLAWDRGIRRRRDPDAPPANGVALLQLATIGVLSHPMLDWLNTYGIRLLMPFSNHWFRGNSLFIVDPYLWLLFAVGLVAARYARPNIARAWQMVRISGVAALAYIAIMIALSAAGERIGRAAAVAQGTDTIQEVLYSPRPANPLAADLVVRTSGSYHLGALRWFSEPRVTFTGEIIPRGDWEASTVQRARSVPVARNYLTWSQFPYVRIEAHDRDTSVFFGDARYHSGLASGLSGLRVTLPPPH